MTEVRIGALIPTLDNPDTIGEVVDGVRRHLGDVFIVDDGGGAKAKARLREIEAAGLAKVIWRERNGGKGAAVMTGLAVMAAAGFTHALQIDADNQHDSGDVPRFCAAARQHPTALVLGAPRFDDSAPRARRIGRLLTTAWTHVETLGRVIVDPLCGYRVYPIAASLATNVRSVAMDFDPEIAVTLAWRGCPVINVPTRVRYFGGGVSHFRMLRDNVLISWMHTRQVLALFVRIFRGPWPRRLLLP